jgi:hypothetical protein
MSKLDRRLDAEQLMILAERVADLPALTAEWVGLLLQELLRACAREAELLACQPDTGQPGDPPSAELDDQQAQLALDTATWLKTLWTEGYMGAGNFRAPPRSAFPAIDLEDVRKSSLFARIRQGKHALPFAPPTRHGLPWHELLEGGTPTHTVAAEIIDDETGVPLAAIIEGCADWQVIEESKSTRQYLVQHQGKGPAFRLRLTDALTAELHREPPSLTRKITLHGRGGIRSYTLEWPDEHGAGQSVPLRAATWERAESEAEHWLAMVHPERYGQVRFERCEQ